MPTKARAATCFKIATIMILTSFLRVIKFAIQNMSRNFWLAIVTISIITLALFTTSSLLIFNLLTEHTLQVVENKTDIYVDLTKEATPEQAKILVEELSNLSAVREVQFITPAETLDKFREKHKDNPLILSALDSVSENPFRGSIRLNVNNIEDFPTILNELSKKEYSKYLEIEDQEFNDARMLIEGISVYSKKIQNAAMTVSLLFIIISFLVVFNTIQVGIYTHREEIGIMKLVGASNSFVRSPFLVEGIIYSLIAIIALAAIIYPVLSVLQPYVDSFFKDYAASLTSLLNQNLLYVFGIQLGLAVIITVASSFIAVRRYLKV